MAQLYYYESGEYIAVVSTSDHVTYSTPNNGKKLKIYYKYKPDDITSDSASPAIPERFHLGLVDFVLSRLLGSAEHEARWKESKSKARGYNRTVTYGKIRPARY